MDDYIISITTFRSLAFTASLFYFSPVITVNVYPWDKYGIKKIFKSLPWQLCLVDLFCWSYVFLHLGEFMDEMYIPDYLKKKTEFFFLDELDQRVKSSQ